MIVDLRDIPVGNGHVHLEAVTNMGASSDGRRNRMGISLHFDDPVVPDSVVLLMSADQMVCLGRTMIAEARRCTEDEDRMFVMACYRSDPEDEETEGEWGEEV